MNFLCQVAGQNNQLVHEPSSSSSAKGRASTETSKHTSCVVSDGHHDSKSPSALRVSRISLSPQPVLLVSSLRNPSARKARARSAARCGDDSVHPRVSSAAVDSRIVSRQFPPQVSNCKSTGFFRQHRAHKPDNTFQLIGNEALHGCSDICQRQSCRFRQGNNASVQATSSRSFRRGLSRSDILPLTTANECLDRCSYTA